MFAECIIEAVNECTVYLNLLDVIFFGLFCLGRLWLYHLAGFFCLLFSLLGIFLNI